MAISGLPRALAEWMATINPGSSLLIDHAVLDDLGLIAGNDLPRVNGSEATSVTGAADNPPVRLTLARGMRFNAPCLAGHPAGASPPEFH